MSKRKNGGRASPPASVREWLAVQGRKGGSVKGPSKARTREQAQAAVNARWAKVRKAKKVDRDL